MTDQSHTDLFAKNEVDREQALRLLANFVHGGDDGELYLEQRVSEAILFDNGRVRSASHDQAEGFGLRVVAGETVGYGHSDTISLAAIERAGRAAASVKHGHHGMLALAPERSNARLYTADSPLASPDFAAKTALLAEIDSYVRRKDSRVIQASVSLAASHQSVEILRPDGQSFRDDRPLVRLSVSVVVEQEGRRESGNAGGGGRFDYWRIIDAQSWQHHADEALRMALVNLDAQPAPAGEMDVVLGAGWPGIMLHEAVGHGLEGDFNRKKTSAFSGLMGQRVAAPGVDVVDDGTLSDRRGSISIDDEGTASQSTTLIEDGILVGYMQDRQNARLMGMQSTGNGRRQSYAHLPMPRMTNTLMRAGSHKRDEIIASMKNGLYAVCFGGGQVDIVSGKFVFSCTEAYRVRDGKIAEPVKGAMLIGHGPTALQQVSMIGDDMALDPGIGTCGKNGQGVPVGVGQPTLRIDGLTVGGTSTS